MTWGISCGVPLVDAEGSSCQALTTADSDGYLCTCNTSWCNNIDRCMTLYALELATNLREVFTVMEKGLFLVESTYLHFHIYDTTRTLW